MNIFVKYPPSTQRLRGVDLGQPVHGFKQLSQGGKKIKHCCSKTEFSLDRELRSDSRIFAPFCFRLD